VPFADRNDAGRRLAERVQHLRERDPVVLGLPRGGVPVAAQVATDLGAPLDVIVVRKLGVPAQPELAMGAIGEDGVRILNQAVLGTLRIDAVTLAEVETRERRELERRVLHFRGDRPRTAVGGRTVIIVDDGVATGSTAAAACRVARAHGAGRVVLAVPVGPPESLDELRADADEVVAVVSPADLRAIGEWYEDFTPTTDDEVVRLLSGP
jgi:putative phosphoribosyl transferase